MTEDERVPDVRGMVRSRVGGVYALESPRMNPDKEDDRVPVFGTWRRIYTAVVVTALLAIGLTAVFSHWDY